MSRVTYGSALTMGDRGNSRIARKNRVVCFPNPPLGDKWETVLAGLSPIVSQSLPQTTTVRLYLEQ